MRQFFEFLLSAALVAAAAAADNLLVRDGKPFQIQVRNDARCRAAADGTLEATVPPGGGCDGRIDLRPEWKFLRVTLEMKAADLALGGTASQRGRISFAFYDRGNNKLALDPNVLEVSGTTPWKCFEYNYPIPEGAVRLAISSSHLGKSGTLEFRKLRIGAYQSRGELDSAYDGAALPSEDALWDLGDAWKRKTAARERISLNAIWAFLPADDGTASRVPGKDASWLYFKVPGIWPKNDRLNAQAQLIRRANGAPENLDGGKLNRAWYRRTVAVPKEWSGRKIELDMELIQSHARVFVDGKEAGELFYPGGKLDLTTWLKPGKSAELALLVTARPDPKAGGEYSAPGRFIPASETLENRGIPGDVYLTSLPAGGALLGDLHVITSVRKKTVTCDAGFRSLPAGRYYRLEAEIFDAEKSVKRIQSSLFTAGQAKNNRIQFSAPWEDPKLWDTDSPQNLYTARLTLRDGDGKLLDELEPEVFGFREITISGRDILINGKKIHLRSIVLMASRWGADLNTPDRIELAARRMKEFGYNYAIGAQYNFNPGTVSRLDAFKADGLSKYGILTSFTLPHAANFQWKLDDPKVAAAYRAQCEYLIRRFQNVPGIIFYATTHNASGYKSDQNPLQIDGVYSPDPFMRKAQPDWYQPRQMAALAGRIINEVDPTRPVYHHESGNLGAFYTINCYLNWAPRQERSDWFEHWEKHGVKPLLLLEWGMPHEANWSTFRGPGYIWGEPFVQFGWLDEYNSAIIGERAYALGNKRGYFSAMEKAVSKNQPIYFSSQSWFRIYRDVIDVWSYMIPDTFRSIRARGVSGLLPWDWSVLSENTATSTFSNPDCFRHLKEPGIVPDQLLPSREYISHPDVQLGFLGEVASAWFAPQIGWIAGKIGDFTEKGHNFCPGEDVAKSLVILNDTRQPRTVQYEWGVPELKISKRGSVTVEPGGRADLPCEFTIPDSFAGDALEIRARFGFDGAPEQTDHFRIDVRRRAPVALSAKVALFDPEGSASPLLDALQIPYTKVGDALPAGTNLLIVGRNALQKLPFKVAPHLRGGMKMAVLEQPSGLLARLGIRSTELGLREIFPVGNLLGGRELHDWRGSSTLIPPYFEIKGYYNDYPLQNWDIFKNTRVWRAGNRGTVCSVLPEKPSVGNWMPLLQGGFDLQYAPLLLFRSGKGAVLFSQLDISGRSESDPEAIDLLGMALKELDETRPETPHRLFFSGDPKTAEALAELKFAATPYRGEPLADGDVLVIGRNAQAGDQTSAVAKGAKLLLIGLPQAELDAVLPGKFRTSPRNGFSDFASGLDKIPEFAGITNSELHRRKTLSYDGFDLKSPGGDALECVHVGEGAAVALQYSPADFETDVLLYRTSRRRAFLLLNRLLHNLGASVETGFVEQLDARNANTDGKLDLSTGWIGCADAKNQGRKRGYDRPDFKPDSKWRSVQVPGLFDTQFKDLGGYDGLFWYRKSFDMNKTIPEGAMCELSLGAIDDESWVWLNGTFLGEVTKSSNPRNYWMAERKYQVPAKLLKPRGNSLVVLVNDTLRNGGIMGSPILLYPSSGYRLYPDTPIVMDDPYRYNRW